MKDEKIKLEEKGASWAGYACVALMFLAVVHGIFLTAIVISSLRVWHYCPYCCGYYTSAMSDITFGILVLPVFFIGFVLLSIFIPFVLLMTTERSTKLLKRSYPIKSWWHIDIRKKHTIIILCLNCAGFIIKLAFGLFWILSFVLDMPFETNAWFLVLGIAALIIAVWDVFVIKTLARAIKLKYDDYTINFGQVFRHIE